MDDSSQSASKDIPFDKACDMQKEQFADTKGDGEPIAGELEEEEILNPNDVALVRFISDINFTLVSAMLYMLVCLTHALRPDCPRFPSVTIGDTRHEFQTSSQQCTLLRGILYVSGLLGLCVALIIGLGKIFMGQYKLKLRLPFYDPPRTLPKFQMQSLRAIPASMPSWYMWVLKSLSLVFPAIQFTMTVALVVTRFYLTE